MVVADSLQLGATGPTFQRQHWALRQILSAIATTRDRGAQIDQIIAAACYALDAAHGWLTAPPMLQPFLASAQALLAPNMSVVSPDTLQIAVPLGDVQDGGTVAFVRSPHVGDFTPDDLAFAHDVAAQLGSILDAVASQIEIARRVERAEILREVTNSLNAELDMGRFLGAAREQIARLVAHDSCWVAL